MSIADEQGGAAPAPTSKELREKQLKLAHAANEARDARKWKEAAALYRQYLDINADTPGIWVQYGHMLKESGNRTEAADAYEAALRLEPENADTYLQFGHLYKLDRQKHKAIQMYKKALQFDPELKDAADELQRMGMKAQTDAVLKRVEKKRTRASFYFDVSDILMYFGGARTPTGIQRICLALIDAVFAERDDKEIGLCAVDHKTGIWRPVDSELFLVLVLLSREGSDASDEQWHDAVIETQKDFSNSAPLVFPQDSVVVNLGSPWGIPNYFLAVRDAKRQSNIFYVGFVHDTIPLLFPEYCDANTALAYTNWIASVGAHADLMLANAENTKRDFETVLAKIGDFSVPCEVVPPNGSFASDVESSERASEEVLGVIGGKYVLFVGTIEPRKNHLFVMSAWRRLVAEMGPSKVPTLVVAGRLGWHCEAVVEFVKKTDSLNGKLKMLNSVSDVDLQTLYRHAMFTVYNSLYEGWGLPVTESLSYGKVPVIPNNSSLTESGGEHAVFYETNSEPSFLSAIRELLTKPDVLKRREQAIHENPPIRTWSDIFNNVFDVTSKVAEQSAAGQRAGRPPVRLGQIYKLRTRVARKDPMSLAIAESARIGTGWHVPEPWGVWTSQKTFQLEFNVAGLDSLPVPLDASQPDLFLFVAVSGHKDNALVRLEVNELPTDMVDIPAGLSAVVRVELRTNQIEDNKVRVVMNQNTLTDLAKLTDGGDTRVIGIGVRSFMVCSAQDMVSRVEFLEEEGANYLIVSTDAI